MVSSSRSRSVAAASIIAPISSGASPSCGCQRLLTGLTERGLASEFDNTRADVDASAMLEPGGWAPRMVPEFNIPTGRYPKYITIVDVEPPPGGFVGLVTAAGAITADRPKRSGYHPPPCDHHACADLIRRTRYVCSVCGQVVHPPKDQVLRLEPQVAVPEKVAGGGSSKNVLNGPPDTDPGVCRRSGRGNDCHGTYDPINCEWEARE
jgi:hypothetical protein